MFFFNFSKSSRSAVLFIFCFSFDLKAFTKITQDLLKTLPLNMKREILLLLLLLLLYIFCISEAKSLGG